LVVIPEWGTLWKIYCIEYAVRESNLGHRVTLLDLSDLNPKIYDKKIKKIILKFMIKNPINSIIIKICNTHGITYTNNTSLNTMADFSDIGESGLKIFEQAIASKYAMITGGRNTKLSDLDPIVLAIESKFFASTYAQISEMNKKYDYSEITTVNGRYVVDGAVVVAARHEGVQTRLLESGRLLKPNLEVYSQSPHSYTESLGKMLDCWASAPPNVDSIISSASAWKLAGKISDESSWTSAFKDSFDNWEQGKKRAVFFPTSDIEFPIFEEFQWSKSFDGSQIEAFKAFHKIATKHGYQVVIRVHPPGHRPKIVSQQENRIWGEIGQQTGSLVIESESTVDSFRLIRDADLCIAYSSTIGIDAILLDAPILMLGEAEFTSFIPSHCAFDEATIQKRLLEEIFPPDKSLIYPWLYYAIAGGIDFNLFEYSENNTYLYNGKLVNQERKIYIKFKRLITRIKKFRTKNIMQLNS
jgi:hypothetical protein